MNWALTGQHSALGGQQQERLQADAAEGDDPEAPAPGHGLPGRDARQRVHRRDLDRRQNGPPNR